MNYDYGRIMLNLKVKDINQQRILIENKTIHKGKIPILSLRTYFKIS